MILRLALSLFCLLTISTQAWADAAKTFVVAPFAVHGPQTYTYLQKGIPSMLQTRLTWPGHFQPLAGDLIKAPLANREAAKQALASTSADYLVYGSVTIMDKQCSLDVQLLHKDGKATPFTAQTTIDQLIPSLETTAKQINADVFQRPEAKPVQETAQVNQMNPNLVFNQSRFGQQAVLNPQFRYESTDQDQSGRWRSQSLPHKCRGMLVVDADNDGTNEIFIMDEHTVYAYREQDNRLAKLDVFQGSRTAKYLNINALDINRDGLTEIFISAVDGVDEKPASLVLTFAKGKFMVEQDRIKLFFNVVKLPPDFISTLVGQKKGHGKLFDPGVYELVRMSGEYKQAKRLALPEKSNVFNFAYLPQGDDYKVIVAHNDHLIVNSSTNDLQAVTEEMYAASGVKLEDLDTIPGMGVDRNDADMRYHYLPTRLLPTNLDHKGHHELIVARPVSIASDFFSNYRNFSQGEIHSLDWDGIGLNIVWKTRRIKGTLVDYAIADYNNNGKNDLVVCVQTYPGATGLKAKRTIVVAYPLDQESPQ
ncbi:FG-GAP-like repeat-containing protein [Desulfoplanes formicivorans]|uniref:VCBS repeat-containing protein n=1 Tax=Desulfoplanes formicivorans TaxID=1592317 RepID=A0A194AJ98_9BACT|nr:FG-GAP-like repeat-containing protein [Desulfoplanes formicivorans]GAU08824.1 hypothetical protein DPF_1541 [Desulfoplanes formicivorans]